MTPQTFTRTAKAQSPGGTSVSRVPCIGTPALLRAMCNLPNARSLRQGVDNRLLQRHVDLHRHDAFIRSGEPVRGHCQLKPPWYALRRWRVSSGRGTPLLAYCASRSQAKRGGKRRPQSAKLTMPVDRNGHDAGDCLTLTVERVELTPKHAIEFGNRHVHLEIG